MKTFEVPYTFTTKGYHVVEANDPDEALELAKLNFHLGSDETVALFETIHFCDNEIEEL